MRYDRVYANAVQRALETADVSLRAFMQRAGDAGMTAESIAERLIYDLETSGPVFGPFIRSLEGAARTTATTAYRQGSLVGQAAEDAALRDLMKVDSVEDLLDEADPEALDEAEQHADSLVFRWVATMINTCAMCLPLHGQVNTLSGWRELGLHPDSIHADQGWSSSCQCSLVAEEQAGSRAELISPLLRERMKDPITGKSIGKTRRAVLQQDLDKAIAARDKAMQTLEGRRALRLIGATHGADES